MLVVFFLVKQKTAYEMRISDWSSDVCASDLGMARNTARQGAAESFSGTAIQRAGVRCTPLQCTYLTRDENTCAACKGHSPTQCQLPISNVMPTDRPAPSRLSKNRCKAGSVPALNV